MSLVWTFGGTALTTFGKIIDIDGYPDIPSRRGSDQIVPFQDGEMHAGKYFDKRFITFYMVTTAASAAALETTMNNLVKLIAPRTQQTLSLTREDSSVIAGQAIVNTRLQTKFVTDKIIKLVLEFTIPRTFLRLSTVIADNTTTINTSPKAMTVTNPGNFEERNPTITLTGPLLNTVITNSTNGISLTYTGTIAGGESVVISTNTYGEYTALKTGAVNVIGNVSHNGAAAFMVFNVGDNILSITDGTATTGTVKASFYAPY